MAHNSSDMHWTWFVDMTLVHYIGKNSFIYWYRCFTSTSCLQHHAFRSYLGLACLIQISTREEDFIVDPLALRGKLTILNEVFTDPKIIKVRLLFFLCMVSSLEDDARILYLLFNVLCIPAICFPCHLLTVTHFPHFFVTNH